MCSLGKPGPGLDVGARRASESVARIFNIQRYSIHDGPGIRTTVFFKGCNLRCSWCSNPESQEPGQEILVRRIKCTACGRCLDVCGGGALGLSEGQLRFERSRCDQCLKCAAVCLPQAIVVCGQSIGAEDLLAEVEKDRLFYENSGGGVTASGGEPLLQWQFLLWFFQECHTKGIATALDTAGHISAEVQQQVLHHTDLVLYDVKHMNPMAHSELTGQGNGLILANARLAAAQTRTWLRLPLLPGVNDDRENLEKLGHFAIDIGVEKVSILPYHALGEAKYEQLGRDYPAAGFVAPDDAQVENAKEVIEGQGIEVTVAW